MWQSGTSGKIATGRSKTTSEPTRRRACGRAAFRFRAPYLEYGRPGSRGARGERRRRRTGAASKTEAQSQDAPARSRAGRLLGGLPICGYLPQRGPPGPLAVLRVVLQFSKTGRGAVAATAKTTKPRHDVKADSERGHLRTMVLMRPVGPQRLVRLAASAGNDNGTVGAIRCRSRLGGLLNYYRRETA
jgi:hypothetical protein